jgi:homoserine dehydrogenase
MILAALVFRRQLRPEQVVRRGITDLAPADFEQAASAGGRLKHVATLSRAATGGDLTARVEPTLLLPDDPLMSIEGVTNAVVCRAEPVGDVTIIGPGAGTTLAGQGVLSDLIAVARALNSTHPRAA